MKAQEIRVLHFGLALYGPSLCLELLTHHKELVKFSFRNGWTDVIHYRRLDKFLCVRFLILRRRMEKVPSAFESKLWVMVRHPPKALHNSIGSLRQEEKPSSASIYWPWNTKSLNQANPTWLWSVLCLQNSAPAIISLGEKWWPNSFWNEKSHAAKGGKTKISPFPHPLKRKKHLTVHECMRSQCVPIMFPKSK
jgi:hypothetical protein